MSVEDVQRERRDREVERSAGRKVTQPFACKVVGVSFVDAYPDNLYALDEAWSRSVLDNDEPLVVILVRNPDNPYDANAIEVHVPALGEEWGMIGHLTRPIAARLAPELDAGHEWRAQVESVLIDPDHLDRPGISIKCAPAQKETEHGA